MIFLNISVLNCNQFEQQKISRNQIFKEILKMKKISRAITKKKLNKLTKFDNLFTKDVISLDDKSNKQYLDDFVYQSYLSSLKKGSDDFDE
jgi:hypothetical protein